MRGPGPPAKTQRLRVGQECPVPITVGQWYAALNWTGGAGAFTGVTIMYVCRRIEILD